MFGAGNQRQSAVGIVQENVVGNERFSALFRGQALDDGMAPGGDLYLSRRAEPRPDVIALGGNLRQPAQQVELPDGSGGGADASGLLRRFLASLAEDSALDLENPFLRFQHLRFPLLELGRGEPFRVDQGLLAVVMVGNLGGVRLRDLDIEPENVVEADFERVDAGLFALAPLHPGDESAAVAANFPQLVELAVEAGGDDSPVADVERRRLGDGPGNAPADVGKLVHALEQIAHAPALKAACPAAQRRQKFEGIAESDQISRRCRAGRHPGEKPFHVRRLLELAAQLAARDRGGVQLGDGLVPLFDLRLPDRRLQNPFPEQARAHRSRRAVEDMQQRRFFRAVEQRRDELEVADRHRVQHHPVLLLEISGPLKVLQSGALRVLQVMHERPGGGHGVAPARGAQAVNEWRP